MLKSIKQPVQTNYTINKSKFITNLIPVNSLEEIEDYLKLVNNKYADANHNCYAYLLQDQTIQKYSDDGEPTKTAGYPILNTLIQNELDDVLCIVTRYFGGIKLGSGGLIRAYSNASMQAINQATLVTKLLSYKLEITFNYNVINEINLVLNNYQTQVLDKNYLDKVTYLLIITISDYEAFSKQLINLTKADVLIEILQTLKVYYPN